MERRSRYIREEPAIFLRDCADKVLAPTAENNSVPNSIALTF